MNKRTAASRSWGGGRPGGSACNIQGNRFATEYPIGLKGVSHSMAMYYGYVAGKNALKDI